MPDALTIARAAAVGVGATLMMDAWNLSLRRLLGIPSLDYRLLGRWLLHMPAGQFAHANIAASPAKGSERFVGYVAHYSIGIGLALGFVALVSESWLAQPTWLPALLYGIATVVFPYFVMQPALGFGVASSRAGNPAQARVKSLATHTVFGLGLYLAATALRDVIDR